MSLKPAQFTVIRAAVIAAPAAKALYDADDWSGLRDWLNSPSATTTNWSSSVAQIDCEEAPNYVGYESLSQGVRDSWRLFISRPRDFTRAKVRNWVEAIWGTAAAGNNAEKVLKAGAVKTTMAQEALAINAGLQPVAQSTVSALKLVYEGQIDDLDAKRIIRTDSGVKA